MNARNWAVVSAGILSTGSALLSTLGGRGSWPLLYALLSIGVLWKGRWAPSLKGTDVALAWAIAGVAIVENWSSLLRDDLCAMLVTGLWAMFLLTGTTIMQIDSHLKEQKGRSPD